MNKPQKLKPCACIITHGNPSFALCTEFERGFPEPMETPSLRPCIYIYHLKHFRSKELIRRCIYI